MANDNDRDILRNGLGPALEVAFEMVGGSILSRISWIIEIPEAHQARFRTGKAGSYGLADLLCVPGNLPNTQFIHGALEGRNRSAGKRVHRTDNVGGTIT